MGNEDRIREIISKFEMAEAQLSDDIRFLHCIDEEYLSTREPRESLQYLYQQLSAMIITVIKSMEYNQKEMASTINNYYEELKGQKEGEQKLCKKE